MYLEKKEELKQIKNIIEDFFGKAGFLIEIKSLEDNEETISVKIKTEEPKVLIGQNGQTLMEVQHLLRAVLKHKIAKEFFLDIDINDYKEKKKEYLKETAVSLADEVALLKKEKILPPMSSYERRVIHLILSKREDVFTESLGEGSERRLVIKPKQ